MVIVSYLSERKTQVASQMLVALILWVCAIGRNLLEKGPELGSFGVVFCELLILPV